MCNLLRNEFFKLQFQAEKVTKQTFSKNKNFQSLPELFKKYMIGCGFNGSEEIRSATVKWKTAALRLKDDGLWKPMTFVQHNFLAEPIRLTYMKTKNFQLMPMEAIDSYILGKGRMKIRLMYIFPIANTVGKEMDQAELVTILAETILVPHYALQHYTRFEKVGDLSIRGTITNNGISASGIFYFNESFEAVKFQTDDRYFTNDNGSLIKTKWTVLVGDYSVQNGYRFPKSFRAIWNRPNVDYEYFKGEIEKIELN